MSLTSGHCITTRLCMGHIILTVYLRLVKASYLVPCMDTRSRDNIPNNEQSISLGSSPIKYLLFPERTYLKVIYRNSHTWSILKKKTCDEAWEARHCLPWPWFRCTTFISKYLENETAPQCRPVLCSKPHPHCGAQYRAPRWRSWWRALQTNRKARTRGPSGGPGSLTVVCCLRYKTFQCTWSYNYKLKTPNWHNVMNRNWKVRKISYRKFKVVTCSLFQ